MRATRDIVREAVSENWLVTEDSFLVTEFVAHSPRDGSRAAFRFLRETPSEAAARNIMALIAAAAKRDERWLRVALKSCKKRGRCPRRLRTSLRAAVLGITGPHPARTLIPHLPEDAALTRQSTPLFIRSGLLRRRTVSLTTEATNIGGLDALIGALRDCRDVRSIQLELEGSDHLYVAGLVTLGAWQRATKTNVSFTGADAHTHDYLERIGFGNLAQGMRGVHGDNLGDHALAITLIDDSDPEDLARKLRDVCDSHGYLGKEDRSALVIAFAELIENVKRHAGPDATATIGAQYYPARRKLTIALADCGIGIRESFLAGRNADAKRRIANGENPLRLAISPLVTSKPVQDDSGPGHSGYGLYVVSELAIRNGGTFRLISGRSSLTTYRRSYHGQAYRKKVDLASCAAWPGTVVVLLLDLNSLLPIGEVYETITPPSELEFLDFVTP